MDRIRGQKLLFEVADTLEKYNIEYWLMHGTCLGAYRDKQIIENDKD